MKHADISVVLTAHSETVVGGPTLRSAEIAISAAEMAGFRVERLIGLDAASEDCIAFFLQPAFSAWKKTKLGFQDIGQARNALAEIAVGRWIAWLDADDLFSENWLVSGADLLSTAEKVHDRVIVHPELNWFFDGTSDVFTKPPQNDPLFVAHYFYFNNYYDMLCMAPRAAMLEIPFTRFDIANGLTYEDWVWSIETMAAGWRHVTAKDTVIFKRRRDMSLVVSSAQRRTLIRAVEPMAIDRVAELGRASGGARGPVSVLDA